MTKPAPAVKKAEVSIKSQEEEEEEEEESEEEEDSEEEESEEEESEESESSEEEDLTPYERAEQRLMVILKKSVEISMILYEPRCEKTGLRGFRPGPTQTGLNNHRRWLEA